MPSKKPGLFTRAITSVLPGVTRETLMDRRAAAEAALRAAEDHYGRMALLTERDAPGAAAALLEAQEALILAQAKVRGVLAAQMELEAEEREASRQADRAAQEARDKRSREVFGRQAKVMAELADVIDLYAAKYQEAVEAEADVSADWGQNLTLREIELHMTETVREEIARRSRSDHAIPPGGKQGLEDRKDFEPLGQRYANRAKAALAKD